MTGRGARGDPLVAARSDDRNTALNEVTIPLGSHSEAILVLGPYDRYAKLLRQALDIEDPDYHAVDSGFSGITGLRAE